MLWWFAQTTLIAGALAVVATLAGRGGRLGPEARHALWLLVLIKLAIPPFVAWPWSVPDARPARAELAAALAAGEVATLPQDPPIGPPARPTPGPEATPAGAEVPHAAAPGLPPVAAPPEAQRPSPRPRVEQSKREDLKSPIRTPRSPIRDADSALLAAWLAGSAVVVARRGAKAWRFHRGLAAARPAPGWLVEEARAIGDRMGVRPPPVVATPRVATPLLWCLGRTRLVLPDALIGRLGADRWPGILAHELAHLARGDQWVVRLELLVEAVWWWSPLFWLARRKLHEQAEIACDARVVRCLPERRHAYAEALVDVCEHIARSAIPSPALGVGGGPAHSLEGRLHMILRDPVPRRPGRRAALLALLLAALSLPSWTLGQQPEASPTRPDGPPAKPEVPAPPAHGRAKEPTDGFFDIPQPQPVAAPAAEGPPQAADSVTIEAIVAARVRAREGLGPLAFRYVVAGRDQSRLIQFPQGWGGVGGGMTGRGGTGGGPVAANLPTRRTKAVHVEVADVVLGRDGRFRYDVLEARPVAAEPVAPGRKARPQVWDRRLVAFNGEGYLALEMARDQAGPVPFRWLGGGGRQPSLGDSLASSFQQGLLAVDQDRGIDPLEPRPANLLDLAGAADFFLDPKVAHAEVVGLETIDGRPAVRVAWIANHNPGLRGLCWLAPDLGYAVVRSDATMDPGGPRLGRWSWRKQSAEFEAVGRLWLPSKVSSIETQADPAGGEPARRLEREATFEDYRLLEKPLADTFRPRLAIQAIDDLSGNFTAQPPEVPAGLADRLARAVAEGPFGPPAVETSIEEPRAVASQAGAPGKPGEPQAGVQRPDPAPTPATPDLPGENKDAGPDGRGPIRIRPRAGAPPPAENVDIQGPRSKAPAGLLAPAKPDDAKADPGIIRPVPADFDPMPMVDPKVNDPITPRRPAEQAELDRAIQRRSRLDPEVVALSKQMEQPRAKLAELGRLSRSPDDPAVKAEQQKLDSLKNLYEQLREIKSGELREELLAKAARDAGEVEVLQARRDGKAAEVQISLARSIVQRIKTGPKVSPEDLARGEAELAIADATVAAKKADLAEAVTLLSQAQRPLEGRPAMPPGARPANERPASLPELRDAIELAEVQLQGKQAELRKVQAMADLARLEANYAQKLADKKGVSKVELELYNAKADAARGELEGKKAEVLEFEIRLKQGRRRLEAGEAQLRRDLERVKARLDWSEDMRKKGYVSKATYEADKAAYDELMIQLDPKYVPAPGVAAPDGPPPPAAPR